jgi:hypothetical protein
MSRQTWHKNQRHRKTSETFGEPDGIQRLHGNPPRRICISGITTLTTKMSTRQVMHQTLTPRRVHVTITDVGNELHILCMSVALVIQYAKGMGAVLSSVAQLALPYLSTSHKRHDFRGKNGLNIKCAFRFCLEQLSETFLTV